MKLFAFRPDGHGQQSFFVVAKDELEARERVTQHIIKHYGAGFGYDVEGWGTDYYSMTEHEITEVIENDNS